MAYRDGIDLESTESRRVLARMILRLFQHWKLSTSDQLALLGLSGDNDAMLSRYAKDEVLPTRDLQNREAWMLSIHECLRILYPQNEEICYSWVSRRNKAFDNLTPLDVMKEDGFTGIVRVGRHLEARLEQG